jgi:hypothetical protein
MRSPSLAPAFASGLLVAFVAMAAPASVVGCGSAATDGGSPLDGAPLDPGEDAPADVSASEVALDPPKLVSDLALDDLAVFQTVRVALAKGGVAAPPATPNAPVVAGRKALVRAYVTPAAGFVSRAITAELELDAGAGPTVIRDTRTISGASREADPASVFAFAVDAAQITTGTRFSVRLTDASGKAVATGSLSVARYPRDGALAALGARDDAGGVRVTLVPVRWTGDGSNRLPDTSAAQLDVYRAVMTALYPIAHVEFTVRAPIDFGKKTLTGNVDFSALNQTLTQLRAADAPATDVYYYALVNPADSFAKYCSGSCVTGQSFVVGDPTDETLRVGGGVGWTGEDSAWTMAHELGHEHGRSHAPCGVKSWDTAYPYTGAQLGTWGWDSRNGTFQEPTKTTDFMGYCDPAWTSDYTYAALFARVRSVRGAAPLRIPGPPQTYRFLRIPAAGAASWGADLRLGAPPSEPTRPADVLGLDGARLARIEVPTFALSHDDATYALVPIALPAGARWIQLEGGARIAVGASR